MIRCNPKKAKVKTLESRGSKSPAGAEWGVPYSMMEPYDGETPKSEVVVGQKPTVNADDPVDYCRFDEPVKTYAMLAINQCYCDLSPENLSCDGEAPRSHVIQRGRELNRQLKALFVVMDREVSETAAWKWYEAREAAEKEQNEQRIMKREAKRA